MQPDRQTSNPGNGIAGVAPHSLSANALTVIMFPGYGQDTAIKTR
jgi:hypothetical protein